MTILEYLSQNPDLFAKVIVDWFNKVLVGKTLPLDLKLSKIQEKELTNFFNENIEPFLHKGEINEPSR